MPGHYLEQIDLPSAYFFYVVGCPLRGADTGFAYFALAYIGPILVQFSEIMVFIETLAEWPINFLRYFD